MLATTELEPDTTGGGETAPLSLCEPCSGMGKVIAWLIPGYRWGTVRGVKNQKVVQECPCCQGVGTHPEECRRVNPEDAEDTPG